MESPAEDFSGVLASILAVDQQYNPAPGTLLTSSLAEKETQRILDESTPDELLSCVLTQLNGREHQLGILCILENVARRKQERVGPLTPLATQLASLACEFLTAARPTDYISTSRVWSNKLCSLCVATAKVAMAAASDVGSQTTFASSCIGPLSNGLECITQSDNKRITPLNGMLLKLCVMTKCHTKAVALLASLPSLYDPGRFETKLSDVLGYFLYGAEALLELKRYEEAMQMLTGAVVMPMFTPQAMATTALKKYVLTSLILDGELRELPSYTSSIINRALSQDIPDYANLIELAKQLKFERGSDENVQELRSYIASKQMAWENDGNSALVAVIADELHTKLVLKRCMKTYTTVPKGMLMKNIGLASESDLDRILLKFSGSEQSLVRVDDDEGVVYFPHASSANTIPSMDEIMELILQTTEAKSAVDKDWADIENSDLFRKSMVSGRSAPRKKNATGPPM